MDDGLKKWLPWIAGGAVLLIIIAIFALTRGGGDDVAATTTTTTEPVTTTEQVTTTVPDTTVPDTTTTTVAATTTTAASTTTTTSAGPADVEFTNEGIYAGETWIYFGYDDEDTIAAVTAVLGAPTDDSGWIENFLCPPPEVRRVQWDDLYLLFTKADSDFWSGGIPHFFAYEYSGTTPELLTTEGIGLDSTLADLEAAYGGPDLIIEESAFVAGEGYWTYKAATWTGMRGFTTGLGPSDLVTSINGGQGCGE